VNVWMVLKILAPGVEHAQKANFGSEMSGIGGDLQQSRGAGVEQEVVDNFLVLQRQPREFVRQGENDMDVADRQQFFASFGEPLVARISLALRTMAVAAGME
jgi:hypothetical protein